MLADDRQQGCLFRVDQNVRLLLLFSYFFGGGGVGWMGGHITFTDFFSVSYTAGGGGITYMILILELALIGKYSVVKLLIFSKIRRYVSKVKVQYVSIGVSIRFHTEAMCLGNGQVQS